MPTATRSIKINGVSIDQAFGMELGDLLEFMRGVNDPMGISVPMIRKTVYMLEQLVKIGVGYLSLDRPVSTLSGGESQRVKMATCLKKEGGIYIMDEPTTGLHMSDIDTFFQIVSRLVDKGNTVVIIEHNLDLIRKADWIIDLGPEGGKNGGQVMFEGTPDDLKHCPHSITASYL